MAKRSLKDHLTVLFISTLLFGMGLMIGLTSGKMQSNSIEIKLNAFEKNLNSLEVGFLLSNVISDKVITCSYLNNKINEIKNQLEDIGETVVKYEAEAKIKDPSYLSLKKQYTYVRSQYWIMLERLKKECSTNYTTILYMYSSKTPCPACRDQGVVLSHLSAKDTSIFVVPVDADEDLLIINTIKNAFNITKMPSLIINSKQRIEGFVSEDELINVLNNSASI